MHLCRTMTLVYAARRRGVRLYRIMTLAYAARRRGVRLYRAMTRVYAVDRDKVQIVPLGRAKTSALRPLRVQISTHFPSAVEYTRAVEISSSNIAEQISR